MRATVSLIIMTLSALDILGVIELPLYVSIGVFAVAMLIVLDVLFGKPSGDAPKDRA